jgi:trans-aconitate methyltransferase
MKASFEMTLVDRSPGMMAVSKRLNPDLEHIPGDLRTVRLDRQFDAVFVHDAIDYMITFEDLCAAASTAHAHCRDGGVALFVPDLIRETFKAHTDHGGNDGESRSMRYLEWTWDPDPTDSTYTTDYVYAMRDGDGEVNIALDRHILGLFSRDQWLEALTTAGFEARAVQLDVEELESPSFLGIKDG